jgi:hypothetical protein
MLAAMITTSAAFGAAQSVTNPVKLSGETTVTLFDLTSGVCDECVPDILFDDPAVSDENFGARAGIKATATMKWEANNAIKTDYDDSLVKQGSILNTSDVFTEGAGTINASMTLAAFLRLVEDPTGADFGGPSTDWIETTTGIEASITQGIDIPCSIPLPGESPRHCTSAPLDITVLQYEFIPGTPLTDCLCIALKLRIALAVDVSGSGVITLRKVQVVGSGQAVATDLGLNFEPTSPDVIADPVALNCVVPAGSPISYNLTGIQHNHVDTPFTVELTPVFAVILPLLPDIEVPITTWGVPVGSLPGFLMTAPDVSVGLGNLGADNQPPVAAPGGPYSGTEGTAVAFDGSASSDNCGPPTLRWDFSDGGVAFGPTASHVFADNGSYTGLLTATDQTGNIATKTFAVSITNVTPATDAGPDAGGLWGVPIALNGAGTDPGSADQATLRYQWNFGDGSPSASGGGAVTHAYATPGTYTATLQVCDKENTCSTDTASVVVTKRGTSVGNTGATSGTFDTQATLQASLVDQLGAPVNARTVSFLVAGEAAPLTAQTNSAGLGGVSYVPTLVASTAVTTLAFAGDALYEPSTSNATFGVGVKATTITYTGSLTGGPNKTIIVSAKLVDATGKNLGNRTVNFAVGTQTVSGTTDANGVATGSIKLAQKNGTYTASATFTPTGSDIGRLAAASDAKTFKLQAK